MTTPWSRSAAVLAATTLVAACNRASHDMQEQPRTNPATTTPFFADTLAERPPVPGTVERAAGSKAFVSSGRGGAPVDVADPQPATTALVVAHGAERYTIYCLPCHGTTGDGDGPVVQRGFPAPASFASTGERLATDTHLHDAIRHGAGIMFAFADRVSSADAWAIVAYMRTLQEGRPVPRSSGVDVSASPAAAGPGAAASPSGAEAAAPHPFGSPPAATPTSSATSSPANAEPAR